MGVCPQRTAGFYARRKATRKQRFPRNTDSVQPPLKKNCLRRKNKRNSLSEWDFVVEVGGPAPAVIP